MTANAQSRLSQSLAFGAEKSREDYLETAHLDVEERATSPANYAGASASPALSALLTQYKCLREEAISSINNRVKIISFGLTAVSVLSAGALAINKDNVNSMSVKMLFSLAVPLFFIVVLFSWVNEAERHARVSRFIASEAEPRINENVGQLAMIWETALWNGFIRRDEWFGPSMLTLGVFGFISCLSPIFGIFYISHDSTHFDLRQYLTTVDAYVFLYMPYFLLVPAALYSVLRLRGAVKKGKLRPALSV